MLDLVWKMQQTVLYQQNGKRSDGNECQESIIGFIITSGNSAKPLEFLKEALDQMTLFVYPPIAFPRVRGVVSGRYGVHSSLRSDVITDRLRPIGFITQHITFWQLCLGKQFHRMNRIVIISLGQHEFNRVAQAVNNCMDFRRQSTPRAAYSLICRPFLLPLALSCTRIEVESMLRFSMSASFESARNTASNTPSFCHLRNRLYTLCHGP